ncbi:hypothetical protein GOV11_01465 [Candidatus Woesearchaeota archaeon]|nr:hypothetical protein [Candidatus Woesearchaeota archaeon]
MTDMERIRTVEQTLHMTAVQRQAQQSQLDEIEHAISELTSDTTYRIVGSMMVKTDPVKLKEELSNKRETISATLKALEEQESKLREEMQKFQKEAVE